MSNDVVSNVIKLSSEEDVSWLVSKMQEPFKPNEKLADALRKLEQRSDIGIASNGDE